MSPANRLPCLLPVLFLGAAPRAQKPEVAANPDAQLLLDLGNDEKCVDAVRTLTHRGDKGVATLMAAIRDQQFHQDAHRLAVAVYALGKFGDAGAPAAALLLDELPSAQGEVLRNLLWALGEVGPKAQAQGKNLLGPLRALDPKSAAETPVRPGWDYQEWAFACRRIELGVAPDQAALVQGLQARDQVAVLAAAAFLARANPEAAAVPRDELLAAWTRNQQLWRQFGEGYQRAMLELAVAVVRHAPASPEASAARATLIYHFDVEVRLQAVMQMGQAPGSDPKPAVQALQLALTDGSVHVRREAVTALGMIGPPAADALPALTALAQDPDLQIRNRAAAAARAIGRNGK